MQSIRAAEASPAEQSRLTRRSSSVVRRSSGKFGRPCGFIFDNRKPALRLILALLGDCCVRASTSGLTKDRRKKEGDDRVIEHDKI